MTADHIDESFTRKRIVVIGAALAAMVVAGVVAWYAIAAMNSAAKSGGRTNMLPIREIVFSGKMTRVDPDDLKRIAAGIQTIGGSMLHTDLNLVRAAVKQVAWVREVEVRRRFPFALEVMIEEHVPFARWATEAEAESLLVNTYGEVFAAESDDAWPLLAGPQGSSREVMIQFLAFKETLAPTGQALAEVRLSPRRAWQLKLAGGSTLALGRNDADVRLARYVRAYPRIAVLAEPNTRVDLRYETGLAVRGVLAPPIKPNRKATGKA